MKNNKIYIYVSFKSIVGKWPLTAQKSNGNENIDNLASLQRKRISSISSKHDHVEHVLALMMEKRKFQRPPQYLRWDLVF